MSKIFVVVGQTGEYSDRTDWYVCAYTTRELAEKHEWKAKQVANELFKKAQEGGESIYSIETKGQNPYDQKMQMDYAGTDYYVAEVDLRDALPVVE